MLLLTRNSIFCMCIDVVEGMLDFNALEKHCFAVYLRDALMS
jgi:hypothetical protein